MNITILKVYSEHTASLSAEVGGQLLAELISVVKAVNKLLVLHVHNSGEPAGWVGRVLPGVKEYIILQGPCVINARRMRTRDNYSTHSLGVCMSPSFLAP